jgi:phytoene dehydrogenase-like protein
MSPLEEPLTAGVGLVLGALAHVAGWPLPRGGAQSLANALAAHLRSLGGEIVTGTRVRSLDELPRAQATLCDLSPRPLLEIAGRALPPTYRRKLEIYRYGPGVFKVDWALDAPIPWTAAACARAATVHLGGTLTEIAAAEREVWDSVCPERPFVILAQPSLFDPTRAPAGKHTAWAYCHVPNGSSQDMLERIESQVERFAPGFRGRILARSTMGPAQLESHNPNFAGGDIAAGALRLLRLPYSTPVRGLYICSAATAPGPGVHGMCGYFAARRALWQHH